jgi:LmbE family N-acetylglucosaminyl deacetylase
VTKTFFIFVTSLALCATPGTAQVAQPKAPPLPPPDARFKTDILLIVAHPDDETAVGSYLAKAILDDHKQVAVIYCNRGEGGGNTHGMEQNNAMGAIREIEARRATASLGIQNIWFLDGRDTPGQDVFASLENWHHGTVLEQVVRLVRLTRPEVIFTWLPVYVQGENHGDHQASGVIATEAFDMAGDPLVFPAQVAVPRERLDINNVAEGLPAWQPRKIYYFSDAAHSVEGDGPQFDIKSVSPSKNIPYYKLALDLSAPHLTQGDVSEAALEAKKTRDDTKFLKQMADFRLIFGKSVVKASPRGDVFEGVTATQAPFTPPRGYQPPEHKGVTMELGGVFAFYRDFWRAHNIEQLAATAKAEVGIAAGAYLQFPLLLRNDTKDSVEVVLTPQVPKGWDVPVGPGRYLLAPGEVYPAQTILRAPMEQPAVERISWQATSNGKNIGTCTMTVTLSEWTLPQ